MKRVILVRTLGPRNVGLACRATANFGPAELVLVAPAREDLLHTCDFVEMAHGVADAAGRVRVVATLQEALAEVTLAVGFTARQRQHRAVDTLRSIAPRLRQETARPGALLGLVFGNENDGLTTAESDLLADLVRIPTGDEHTSINLATAVAIVLCELFDGPQPVVPSRKNRPLDGAERQRLVHHLRTTLPQRLRGEAGRTALVRAIERLFGRAPLETRDAQVWHKLARELGASGGEDGPA